MDVTTFDAHLPRESTESIRSSLAINSDTADGGAFVEHLLQEPIARRPEPTESAAPHTSTEDNSPAKSSAALEDSTTEVTAQSDTEVVVTADPKASSPDDEDTSLDNEQDDAAGVAPAAAPPVTKMATTDEPTATVTTRGTTEPPSASAVGSSSVADQPSAATPLADTARGGPMDLTNATSGTGRAAVAADHTRTQAIAMVTAAGMPTTAAADSASHDALAAETTEKRASSTQTRTEKTSAKGRATSGKNTAGEASADTSPNSAHHTQDAPDAALGNLVGDLPKPNTAVDPGSQNGTTTTMRTEVSTSDDAGPRSQSLTERLPEQIFGRSSSAAESGDELSAADQMRLIQRVARAIEAAPQNGGILRLRLSPPELGAVRLEVAVRRGKMTARIETESAQTRNVLLDQLPQLRERLEGQGIRIDRFEVEVGPQDHGDSSSQSSHTEDPYRSSSPRENRPKTVASETTATAPTESRWSISATRVNVII
jgi:flagellar hook-length control protein FliK